MPTGSVASTKIVSVISRRGETPVRTTGTVVEFAGLCTTNVDAIPGTRWLSESVMNGVTRIVAPRTESGITSVSKMAIESRSGFVKLVESAKL